MGLYASTSGTRMGTHPASFLPFSIQDKLLSICALFWRDVDETISWIKEKGQLMASDDFGRDLASVQALLRKHEGLERDLAALEDKVPLWDAFTYSLNELTSL